MYRNSSAWFVTVLKSIADAVIATDPAGRVAFVNRAAEELLGESSADVLGVPVSGVVRVVGESQRFVDLAYADGPVNLPVPALVVRRDGRRVLVEGTVAPIRDDADGTLGGVVVLRDVTDRKQAEEQVRRRASELQAIFDAAPVGINVADDPECRVIRGNRFIADLLGMSAGLNLSKSGPDAGKLPYRVFRDGQELAPDELPMQRAARGCADVQELLDVVRGDGSQVTLLIHAKSIPGEHGMSQGAVGIAVDVTRLKQAEEALKASERRLAADLADMTRLQEVSLRLVRAEDTTALLLDLVDAAIAVTDADFGNIQLREPETGLLKIMASRGFDDEFLARFARVVPGRAAAREGERVIVEDVADSPYFSDPECVRALESAGVRAAQSTPLFNRSGEVMGVLSTHYRTKRRPAERDLKLLDLLARQAADSIERMRHEELLRDQAARLREADRRKDEFLAMLAHELRNPLAAVGNAATMLGISDDAESLAFCRDVIDRQTRLLGRLIDDLLDVSRINSGKIRLKREHCDAGTILRNVLESVEPLIGERGHHLVTEFAEGSLPLYADPARIEQVVVNLLTNAAKYTEPGGRIRLNSTRQGDQVVILVEDNGVGISPAKLPEMFELFAQGERSIARSEGGLGIGLTIVKKLTETHGGNVSARSDGAGRGSIFTVRLPAAARQDGTPSKAAPPVQTRRTGARILVVDDSVDTARGMSRLLKLLGNDVRMAHDGPSAIEAARGFEPEYILLDIGLPGMDGYEVARRLRDDPSARPRSSSPSPGYGQEEDRRRSRDAGFDHHLVKPVVFNDLVTLMSRTG
ncbi:MAG: PAS domain S-box protein [Isosphaeraceae bacterium]